MPKKNPHAGSSIESFLKDEGLYEAANAASIKQVIAWQLQVEMKRLNLTKTAMAKRMETSRGQFDRVLNPDDADVTPETLQRAAKIVGRTVKLELA